MGLAALVGCATGRTGPTVGEGSAPDPSGAVRLVGKAGGVRFSVTLTPGVVRPGARVRADVRVENLGDQPVRYSDPCGSDGVGIGVATPLAPGREWPGTLGVFKRRVMARSTLPSTRFLPPAPPGIHVACALIATNGNETLAPHAVLTSRLVWDAAIVPGAPARPGAVSVEASFAAVPEPVVVHGTVHVAGPDAHTPSPGEVVDAALAEPGFARWIESHPGPFTWADVTWFDGLWHVDGCCVDPPAFAPVVTVDPRTGRMHSVERLTA